MADTVGVIGLGKLGLPVALAIESKGYDVIGYDVNPAIKGYIQDREVPFREEGIQPLLDTTKLHVAQYIGEVVAEADLIFLATQTPHHPRYEGTTRLPEIRADFDYEYLKRAVGSVAAEAELMDKQTTLAVISTCLPGTFSREIRPLLNEKVDYVYDPLYIAMGTVIADYFDPEFNLIGVDSEAAAEQLEAFYATINSAPNLRTDITTAEAIKVSYNTFITMKTVLANAWGELCHKTGANMDDLTKAWSLSTKRLLSPKYTKSGVGDGGGCHPRDNIALSYIARELGLSHDIWEDLIKARESHMEWLAREAFELSEGQALVLLGRSFKPETNIETGSPAILASNILTEHGVKHAHVEDLEELSVATYFITTAHERYKDYKFPPGSRVLDPFRIIDDQKDVTIIRIGDNHDISRKSS